MAFRSDRDALRHRVDALEDELRARDQELARVRAELERGQRDPTPPKPKRPPTKLSFRLFTRTTPEPEPTGDRWTLPKSEPSLAATLALMFWAGIFLLTLVPLLVRGDSVAWVPFFIFIPTPIAMLLYRSGVDIDRTARTATIWRQLIVRWEKKLSFDEHVLHVDTKLVTPKNADSYWAGDIKLGDHVLATRKEAEAKALARRIAEFAGVRLADR